MTHLMAYEIDGPEPLIAALGAEGWRVIGPRERDGAIRYAPIDRASDMPRGRSDAQRPGHYALEDGDPDRWFDYVIAPQSWKAWLFPARQKLWSAERTADGFRCTPAETDWVPTALFGVRPCDLAAIAIQDTVFGHETTANAAYAERRANTLVVAVQCARSAETCFCASMGTGPRAEAGFDLALTELDGAEAGRFLLEAATPAGERIAAGLGLPAAPEALVAAAHALSRRAAASQGREMPAGVREGLLANVESTGWEEVATRCIACANCTLACPTCFCSDVEDTTDLSGDHAERWLTWDSCFNLDFSYIHGGSVRRSGAARYRQWLTHKLATWHDQFGSSGCVGCGRCIAWCPVGIDITAEAARLGAARE